MHTPMPIPEWITIAAALMTPHDPAPTARALKLFLPMLGVPDAAFTRGSLDAVVSAKRRMSVPAFDEVAGPLRAWWKEGREHQRYAALPPPSRDYRTIDAPTVPSPPEPPTELQKAAVAHLVKAWTREEPQRAAIARPDFIDRSPPKPAYAPPEQLAVIRARNARAAEERTRNAMAQPEGASS